MRRPFGFSLETFTLLELFSTLCGLSILGAFSLLGSAFPLDLVNFLGWRFWDCDASPPSRDRRSLEVRLGTTGPELVAGGGLSRNEGGRHSTLRLGLS